MAVDIQEFEEVMAQPGFWDDQDKAQTVISDLNDIKNKYDSFNALSEGHEEYVLMLEMLEELPDPDMKKELEDGLNQLNKDIEDYELVMLLNGAYDKNNAILELHPGAGGTESQDFGEMLYRMYTRYIEQKGFSYEIIDYQNGDEAGIKSVTLLVKGEYAYGFLKAEKGVHRLVRISPFDSGGRRHTSFVSCDVTPEITDDIDFDIQPDEIRVDVYRASGAGGQHVNKTESAVRITHIETGIVSTSQAGRSQLANRQTAMQHLKSKLYQRRQEEKEAEMAKLRGEQKEIGWGSQIRSYVFHPYSMVKDHRTDHETGNTGAVMDGELDEFIEAYLRQTMDDMS
ncbi:MAG TPA: peptide chain release factor 2, partial [Atopostipes sp.]|nr:peptide chain release factor 2 [Atopostipes sp.]